MPKEVTGESDAPLLSSITVVYKKLGEAAPEPIEAAKGAAVAAATLDEATSDELPEPA